MPAGTRFADWIGAKFLVWKASISAFILTLLGPIGQVFWNIFRSQLEGQAKDNLKTIYDDPNTPPEMKALLDEAIKSVNPGGEVVAWMLTILGTVVAVLHLGGPQGRNLTYFQDRKLMSYRLDPLSILTAWRRFPGKYDALLSDLDDGGISPERQELLKDITLFYPNPQDLIRWQAREVFEPAMIERYGLDDEFGGIEKEPFYKAGMTDEQILNYWRAHWEHASWNQVVEMLHRGLMTEDDLRDWFRLVEIPPFWRDKLIASSWNIPTRVDVRRFWDMRTIDEARLREIYTALGYHGADLNDYVLWTKIYTDFPNLLARYKNGWITLDRVKDELIAMGMSAERADTMIEEKIKKEAPERVATERDLTKTDIINGVKKNVITRLEAAELLVDMGYSNDEAIYLLDVNIPTDNVTSVKTARELTKSDVLAGLKAGVITELDALNKLMELRYSAVDAEFLLKIYKAAAKPPAELTQREASKADIVTAVKKGLITQEAGFMMLIDIGFADEAALFILSVATEESPFSPVTYDEFKDRTQKYRLAVGLEGKPMTEEIKKSAADVVRLTAEVAALTRSIQEEQRGLMNQEVLPPEVTQRLHALEVARNRGISELERVKAEYERQVAEWRHGLP